MTVCNQRNCKNESIYQYVATKDNSVYEKGDIFPKGICQTHYERQCAIPGWRMEKIYNESVIEI